MSTFYRLHFCWQSGLLASHLIIPLGFAYKVRLLYFKMLNISKFLSQIRYEWIWWYIIYKNESCDG